MIALPKIAAALLTALACAGLAAQDFHLSPTGDDAADGAAEHPWKTLARANRALHPGDRAILWPGTYSGSIAPYHSGLPAKPIVYTAQTPGTAVVTGGKVRHAGKPYNAAVRLSGRAFIEISGLVFRSNNAPLVLSGSHDVVFRDLDIRGPRPAVRTYEVKRCTFRNIDVVSDAPPPTAERAPLWQNLHNERCRFEHLRLAGGGTLFLLAGESARCVVRAVDFAPETGRALVIEGKEHLVENCRVRNAVFPSELHGVGMLFRGNFFIGGNGLPLEATKDVRMYGNAFLQIGGDWTLDETGPGDVCDQPARLAPSSYPGTARLTADAAGRILEVDHPGLFFDGGGIPGETGDTVEIGPEKLSAVIVEIDRGQKLLHLDRTVRAEAGSEVRPVFGR